MDDNQLMRLVCDSFSEALCASTLETRNVSNNKDRNRTRSSAWMMSLAGRLRVHFEGDRDVRVFSSDYSDNQKEFRRNEYLHDILVARTAKVSSPRQVLLTYVTEAIW